MITTQDVMDMYVHLRKTNMSIPDEALGFMKDTCLSALSDKSEQIICTDFKLEATDMKGRTQKRDQPPIGAIFTVTITDR
jgi:hypothetical protein